MRSKGIYLVLLSLFAGGSPGCSAFLQKIEADLCIGENDLSVKGFQFICRKSKWVFAAGFTERIVKGF